MSFENDFANTCLPFCIERQPDGAFMILNGNFLPIGVASSSREVDFCEWPIYHKLSFIKKENIPSFSCWIEPNKGRLFLCDDPKLLYTDPARLDAYMRRLQRILFLEKEINLSRR